MNKHNSFKISIVIPTYNEEGNIETIVEKLISILSNYSDYEIIFVDDGSEDNTLKVLKKLQKQEKSIKYISFSRNFGHQFALKAGMDFSSGDCVISLDADLQHPPGLIPSLIDKWQEGYEIVYTIRNDDPKLSFLKRKSARIFYKIINSLSNIKIDQGTADFRLLDRSVVDILININEYSLFLRGIISWLGFRSYGIHYLPGERFWGKTKYSTKKMISFAINGITSFSIKPLRISILLGSFISVASFCYGLFAILLKFFTDKAITGWTSLLISVLFIGGIQLIILGIIGEYLGKLFIQSKGRPNYIIREKSF